MSSQRKHLPLINVIFEFRQNHLSMKCYLQYLIPCIFISCTSAPKKEIIEVKSEKWQIQEINVEDVETTGIWPYFQKTDTAGSQGYAELKDYGVKGQVLRVLDGKGNVIIIADIVGQDDYKGGFDANTTFIGKPNERKSVELLHKSGTNIVQKEYTVYDTETEVHSVVRFIPAFFTNKSDDINGIQFVLPETRESIYIKIY